MPNPTLPEVELRIEGMTCASCAGRVERALAALPGVVQARVNLVHERATIQLAAEIPVMELSRVVEEAGFRARVRAGSDWSPQQELAEEAALSRRGRKEGIWCALSAVCTAPLLLPMVGMPLGIHLHVTPLTALGLAGFVQFVVGWRFYVGALRALLRRTGNMDLLVALGTSAAFGFSVHQLLSGPSGDEAALYFESSASVITLVCFGKWLEGRAKRSATRALRELLELFPRTCSVLKGGLEQPTPIDDLWVGDHLVVRPGERIAAEGKVLEGTSSVDESVTTGESLPVDRGPGDEVLGGSLNLSGRLVIEVTRTVRDSTLGRILRLVCAAQATKAPVERLVDRLSQLFVPVVLGIALVAGAGWFWGTGSMASAWPVAVSVLVVACPCALGLATPTAIVVGTSVAARIGVLLRDVETLERATQIDTVVFDKTGTVTEGRPQVTTILPMGIDETELLQLAASVQDPSEHPLAKALVEQAKKRGLAPGAVLEFTNHPGQGVSARLGERRLYAGRVEWLRAQGVGFEDARPLLQRLEREASTQVGLAEGNRLLGLFGFADPPRSTARDAIRGLHEAGYRTVLLSGDQTRVARALGEGLGFSEVVGGQSPESKHDWVSTLRREGHHVAMVGDGINDAPALAAADLGIAMGTGTHLAMHSARAVLMRPDPRLVLTLFEIAGATMRKVRQNLFWAFGYNVLGIGLAAAGQLSPMIAGLAMALSSVSVVTNSLLLRRFQPRTSESTVEVEV